MKNKLLTIILTLLCGAGLCQNVNSPLEDRFQLNFVVPDMPAYKAFNVDYSNLLRPADIKEFAVMLSPFYNNGKAVIPKNFALEFAPWKIASKKWTLRDYNSKGTKRFLYRSSFSIGAVSDSSQYAAKLSIGYRFSIQSKKADIILIVYDKTSAFTQNATRASVLKNNFKNYWLVEVKTDIPNEEKPGYFDSHLPEFYTFLSMLDTQTDQPNDLRGLIAETKGLFGENFQFTSFEQHTFENIQSGLIEEIIDRYKKENWNANRFDAALAFVSESKDSVLTNARFSSFNAWATYALKLGKSGQLLVGGRLKLPRATIDKSRDTPVEFSGSARILVGNSNFRFFGETQWENINYGKLKNSVLVNLGGEIRLSNKFWVVASSGINNLKDKDKTGWYNRFVANLDLRYGFNL